MQLNYKGQLLKAWRISKALPDPAADEAWVLDYFQQSLIYWQNVNFEALDISPQISHLSQPIAVSLGDYLVKYPDGSLNFLTPLAVNKIMNA